MRARQAALALAAGAVLAAGAAVGAPASEPRAPASPSAIEAYRASGEWDADLTAQTGRARDFLAANLRGGRRPAIVLDVDDTSLSSYECLRSADFDRDVVGDACAEAADMPAIPQTLELFRYARSQGVDVVFISGRRDRLRGATVANLRARGFTGTWRLYLRPDDQPRRLRAGWKARVRRSLVRRGLRIVINVGDQRSDLSGGSALRTFKLPNPMYVIPVA